MNNLLKDKTAVITGGARGIGRAIATAFLNEGAKVIILDKFFPDDFEEFKSKYNSNSESVISKSLDITNFSESKTVIDELFKLTGKFDILVNNAGITRDKLILRMAEEDWDAVLTVNLKGTFNMVKAVIPYMAKAKYGRIVNISSVVGVMGNAGQANYSASKSGMIGFSKSIAKEFAGRSITVNCIAPGFVETEMTAQLTDEQKNVFLNVIPLKRSTTPEEVAGVVVFFASDKSAYITGQVLCVDGGMIM
jgi:3-oxoacyl-[acyl-carrier protein] reductase